MVLSGTLQLVRLRRGEETSCAVGFRVMRVLTVSIDACAARIVHHARELLRSPLASVLQAASLRKTSVVSTIEFDNRDQC